MDKEESSAPNATRKDLANNIRHLLDANGNGIGKERKKELSCTVVLEKMIQNPPSQKAFEPKWKHWTGNSFIFRTKKSNPFLTIYSHQIHISHDHLSYCKLQYSPFQFYFSLVILYVVLSIYICQICPVSVQLSLQLLPMIPVVNKVDMARIPMSMVTILILRRRRSLLLWRKRYWLRHLMIVAPWSGRSWSNGGTTIAIRGWGGGGGGGRGWGWFGRGRIYFFRERKEGPDL
jgi:hypothetical protein